MQSVESEDPDVYEWIEITAEANWIPQYRNVGGRIIEWMFVPSTVSGFIEDSGPAIDLNSLPGAVGADGNTSGIKLLFRRSATELTMAPTGGTFNTDTGVYADLPADWFEDVPSGTDTLWVTTSNIFGSGTTYQTHPTCLLYTSPSPRDS